MALKAVHDIHTNDSQHEPSLFTSDDAVGYLAYVNIPKTFGGVMVLGAMLFWCIFFADQGFVGYIILTGAILSSVSCVIYKHSILSHRRGMSFLRLMNLIYRDGSAYAVDNVLSIDRSLFSCSYNNRVGFPNVMLFRYTALRRDIFLKTMHPWVAVDFFNPRHCSLDRKISRTALFYRFKLNSLNAIVNFPVILIIVSMMFVSRNYDDRLTVLCAFTIIILYFASMFKIAILSKRDMPHELSEAFSKLNDSEVIEAIAYMRGSSGKFALTNPIWVNLGYWLQHLPNYYFDEYVCYD